MHKTIGCICRWIFRLRLLGFTGLCAQSPEQLAYLKIQIAQHRPGLLLLKETFQTDRSSNSAYKKRYLYAREEYDTEGKPSLSLFYDPQGNMQSKVIFFYPGRYEEKGIYKQKGEFLDSAYFHYNERGQRLRELWYWGENRSRDSIWYSYDAQGRLSGVLRRYDWDTRRDTLLYSGNRLDKCIQYSLNGGMQREVQFVYLPDADQLLKINVLNANRLIMEEEFFFYNRRGLPYRSIAKLYPDAGTPDGAEPLRRQSRRSYHPDGSLRSMRHTEYKRSRLPVATLLERYQAATGYLLLRRERNAAAGLNKTVRIRYTIQKNRTLPTSLDE